MKYRDFLVDLRSTSGVAKRWLSQERPTWDIGTEFPVPPDQVALGKSYDALIHVHEVSPAGTFR